MKGNKTNHANAGRKAINPADKKHTKCVYLTNDQATRITEIHGSLTNAILTTIK